MLPRGWAGGGHQRSSIAAPEESEKGIRTAQGCALSNYSHILIVVGVLEAVLTCARAHIGRGAVRCGQLDMPCLLYV